LTDAKKLLKENALVGSSIESGFFGEPGRDVLATVFAESHFRSTIARGLGFYKPNPKHKGMSLRQIIEMNTWSVETTGMASAYHFMSAETDAPISQEGEVARVLRVPFKQLGDALLPGDTIHVSCGPLSHTTVVFSLDAKKDTILLVDPLFQFWQPTHNSCISTFTLKHYKYGFYLTEVKLSEVVKVIDAIQTTRSFTPSDAVYKFSPLDHKNAYRCAIHSEGGSDQGLIKKPLEVVLTTDLFTVFNFEETQRKALSSEETAIIYVPAAFAYRGKALSVIRIDSFGRALSFSLFVRRYSLDGASGMAIAKRLRDLIRGFWKEVLSSEDIATFAAAEVNASQSGQGFSAVISGHTNSAYLQGGDSCLQAQNITMETGSEWMRLDTWR
jgi:hypothetical protein